MKPASLSNLSGASFGWQRNLRYAMLGAACALRPLAGGCTSHFDVHDRATSLGNYITGLVRWTIHAFSQPAAVYGPRANAVLNSSPWRGIWLAFVLSTWPRIGVSRSGWGTPELTAIVFAAFASLIGYQDIWASAYGIRRTLSPAITRAGSVSSPSATAVCFSRCLYCWLRSPHRSSSSVELKVGLLARL